MTKTIAIAQNAQVYAPMFEHIFHKLHLISVRDCTYLKEPAEALRPPDFVVVTLATPEWKLFLNGRTKVIVIHTSLKETFECPDAFLLLDCKNVPELRPPNVPFNYFPIWSHRFLLRPDQSVQERHIPQDRKTKRKFALIVTGTQETNVAQIFTSLLSTKFKEPVAKFYCPVSQSDLEQFQFVIVIEAQKHVGYVTNGLEQAYLAGALPIYWGAPDVGHYFNTQSFVNLQSFGNLVDSIQYIQNLDANDELYSKYMTAPLFLATPPLQATFGYVANILRSRLFTSTMPTTSRTFRDLIDTKFNNVSLGQRVHLVLNDRLEQQKQKTLQRVVAMSRKDLKKKDMVVPLQALQAVPNPQPTNVNPLDRQKKIYGTSRRTQPKKVGC
jgi:hypothetical protein